MRFLARAVVLLGLGLWLALIKVDGLLADLQPMWPALMIGVLALDQRRVAVIPAAWVFGLFVDTAFGAPLGQHALAMTLLAFAVLRLAPVLRALNWWQAALSMLPIWGSYAFVLFWMDGTAKHAADSSQRWVPVLTTAIVWPALAAIVWANVRKRLAGSD